MRPPPGGPAQGLQRIASLVAGRRRGAAAGDGEGTGRESGTGTGTGAGGAAGSTGTRGVGAAGCASARGTREASAGAHGGGAHQLLSGVCGTDTEGKDCTYAVCSVGREPGTAGGVAGYCVRHAHDARLGQPSRSCEPGYCHVE